jgi:hypothetical protein
MNSKHRILEASCCIAFWSLAVAFAGIATWSNTDLLGPPGFLFMDERFVFDWVKQILDSQSLKDLWWSISDGGDHRYGRIFYYTAAALSWLPYRLYGDPGLIIGIRSSLVIFMLSAYLVLCLGLIKNWMGRALALLLLMNLPFTAYYFTMPKPEPIQLLMLALFLVAATKKKFHFGTHWIFLGLAFGAKISAAPFCAIAGLLGILASCLDRTPLKQMLRQAAKAGSFFALGFVIAVPMLVHPKPKNIDAYLQWTWQGTGHGADDESVNWKTWVHELSRESLVTNNYYNKGTCIIIIFICLFFVCFQVIQWILIWDKYKEWHQGLPWFYLILACSLGGPIIMWVQRLWGFYLHTGFTLCTVSLVAIGEATEKCKYLSKRTYKMNQLFIYTTSIILIAVTLSTLPKVWATYASLNKRTKTPEHLLQERKYAEIQNQLKYIKERNKTDGTRPLLVYYDPILFLPKSSKEFDIKPFWAYEIPYDQNPDIVVLDYKNTLSYLIGKRQLPPASSKEFKMLERAKTNYTKYVLIKAQENESRPFKLQIYNPEQYGIITKNKSK